ncbi:MAG: hypothetical protein CM15mP106_7040 [Candidatus Neomarinimicrobiota bacterium]|nr:MAG: hypothetical protein CM15mP106_7040 [Candidatus Neomarinimicrobiota bacterium]
MLLLFIIGNVSAEKIEIGTEGAYPLVRFKDASGNDPNWFLRFGCSELCAIAEI